MGVDPLVDISYLNVADRRCDECLFSNNRLVSKAQATELTEKAVRQGSYFECHKATLEGHHVVCRGFYDSQNTLCIGLAKMIGNIRFINLKTFAVTTDLLAEKGE